MLRWLVLVMLLALSGLGLSRRIHLVNDNSGTDDSVSRRLAFDYLGHETNLEKSPFNGTRGNSESQLDVAFWMHVQKTSSWFGAFLVLWSCPEISAAYDRWVTMKPHTGKTPDFVLKDVNKMNTVNSSENNPFNDSCPTLLLQANANSYGWHHPIDQYKWLSWRRLHGTIVTILRHPLDRIISAFLFHKGGHIPAGIPDRFAREAGLQKYVRESEHPIITYANIDGIASCQTKMLLGHFCGSNVTMDKYTDIDEARRVVREDLVFVGITHEPNATVELFYSMFGRRHMPGRWTITSTRNNTKHNPGSHDALACELLIGGWNDTADMAVYMEVSKLFRKRLDIHGIAPLHPDLGRVDEIAELERKREKCRAMSSLESRE